MKRVCRRLSFVFVLLLLDIVGAQALDARGLVESLLSPNGVRTMLILPMALLFYGARLMLLFVAPGLLASIWLPPKR